MEAVFEHLRKCVGSKKTNEDALPDDLKKKSILCSVGTTDIKTITLWSTAPVAYDNFKTGEQFKHLVSHGPHWADFALR